jgi:hypothetical protein
MLTETPAADTVVEIACWLESFWRARDDTSFDPYDGLETRRMACLGSLPRPLPFAVVQLNKRSPVNLRRWAGVRPTHNAYTVAHFASACALLAPVSPKAVARGLDDALACRLDWLCDNRVADAWTYPFDVHTKTFSYEKTVPNIICTTFAVAALLDGLTHSQAGGAEACASPGQLAPPDRGLRVIEGSPDKEVTPVHRYSAEARERWTEAVRSGVNFTLEHLLSRGGGRVYFRYLEAEPLLIHNANVLAARFVARAGKLLGEPSWIDQARESLAVTLCAVTGDGLLPYGEGSRESWVDGHHSGFVAEALADLSELLGDGALSETAATVRGAYRRRLFERGGRPLLYPGRRFPVDVITGAQGIQTFAKAGGPQDVAFSQEIASFMLSHMRTQSGTFLYRRGRAHVKAIPYARWSDAPMCLSLAHLGRALRPSTSASTASLLPPGTSQGVTV